MRKIYLDRIGDRRIAALVEDGELEDLVVDPRSKARALPGAVFSAIAERPLKTLGGIVVKLGGGERGFLKGGQGAAVGSSIHSRGDRVSGRRQASAADDQSQIERQIRDRHARYAWDQCFEIDNRPSESARRSLKVLASSNSAAAPGGTGFILRTSSEFAPPDLVAQEVRKLSEASRRVCSCTESPKLLVAAPDADEIARREWHDHEATDIVDGDGSFEKNGIWELIQTHLDSTVHLPSGGCMHIEETSAFVAVDVDTKSDVSRQAGPKSQS